jgi:septin family protein
MQRPGGGGGEGGEAAGVGAGIVGLLPEQGQRRARLRQRRQEDSLPSIAVVGYTNAGKSTLVNTLTNSEVYAADQLFATLDPTTRRLAITDPDTHANTDAESDSNTDSRSYANAICHTDSNFG